jgi:hypothetical protein
VSPFQRTNPFVQSVSKSHRGQGSRTAKYPILIYGDEAGFAELTPEQQEWMMKTLGAFAEAVVAQEVTTQVLSWPGFVPRVASNNRCGSFSSSRYA